MTIPITRQNEAIPCISKTASSKSPEESIGIKMSGLWEKCQALLNAAFTEAAEHPGRFLACIALISLLLVLFIAIL